MKWLQSLLKENPDTAPLEGSAEFAQNNKGAQITDPAASSEVAGARPPFSEPQAPFGINTPATSDVATGAAQAAAGERIVSEPQDAVDPARPCSEGEPIGTVGSVFESLSARFDALAAAQSEIGAGQHELMNLFESRLRSDDVQARAIEKLHELQQYKADFVRRQMVPVIKEVIFCHDFAAREIERMQQQPEIAESPAVRSLDVLRQMLVDLLFKYDVEPYRGEGDTFDARTQQCTKTVPTENPEQDKKIAGVILDGFRTPEGIVRREQVAVYKLTPPAGNTTANESGAS
jgi:molecular chaperone GrpE